MEKAESARAGLTEEETDKVTEGEKAREKAEKKEKGAMAEESKKKQSLAGRWD